MADRLTTEQLNSLSKDELVSMMMSMQDRVESLSSRLDYLTEQIAISNNRQFGLKSWTRSSAREALTPQATCTSTRLKH